MSPEAEKFMRTLMEWGGCADRWNLGPQTSQAENSARQFCKRKGWAEFNAGYWRITDSGCAQFNWQRPTILREMSDENLREALERAYDDIVSGDGDDAADRYEELIQELNRRKVDGI